MSLVHEALEKAAREKQRKTGAAPSRGSDLPVATPPAPSGSGLPTATPRRSRLPWLLAGVALIAVLAALWLAAKAFRQVEQALTPPLLAPAAPVKIVEPAPVVVPPVPVVESRFKLTGIVRMPEGEYSAVINGKPMYETQYVDGAIVKKIERDRVTLDVDGRETTLRLF